MRLVSLALAVLLVVGVIELVFYDERRFGDLLSSVRPASRAAPVVVPQPAAVPVRSDRLTLDVGDSDSAPDPDFQRRVDSEAMRRAMSHRTVRPGSPPGPGPAAVLP